MSRWHASDEEKNGQRPVYPEDGLCPECNIKVGAEHPDMICWSCGLCLNCLATEGRNYKDGDTYTPDPTFQPRKRK